MGVSRHSRTEVSFYTLLRGRSAKVGVKRMNAAVVFAHLNLARVIEPASSQRNAPVAAVAPPVFQASDSTLRIFSVWYERGTLLKMVRLISELRVRQKKINK